MHLTFFTSELSLPPTVLCGSVDRCRSKSHNKIHCVTQTGTGQPQADTTPFLLHGHPSATDASSVVVIALLSLQLPVITTGGLGLFQKLNIRPLITVVVSFYGSLVHLPSNLCKITAPAWPDLRSFAWSRMFYTVWGPTQSVGGPSCRITIPPGAL